jgi:hypothetical protein
VGSLIIGHWVFADPVGAFGYIETLPLAKRLALTKSTRWINRYASAAPFEAYEFAVKNGLVHHRPTRFALATEIVEHSIVDAQQMWQSLKPGKMKDALFSEITRQWTVQDPQAAREWLMEQGEGYDIPLLALDNMLTHWAGYEPQAAAEFASTRLDSQAVDIMTKSVIETWYAYNPVDATDWALAMPKGDTKDKTLSWLFRKTYSEDIVLAKRINAAISSEKQRTFNAMLAKF